MSTVGAKDVGSEAGFAGLSQADVLRISTLHAHGLSRIAAVHAGLQRRRSHGTPSSTRPPSVSASSSDGLAQLAALQGGQTRPALLLAATQNSNHASSSAHQSQAMMGRLQNSHPALGSRRLGWASGTEAGADVATGAEHHPKPSASQKSMKQRAWRGDAQSKLLASAELTVPSYMALHNASCSRCGLPSLPGLTSTSSHKRRRPTKRPRRSKSDSDSASSKTLDTVPGVANGQDTEVKGQKLSAGPTLSCLLCGADVIPGHSKASAHLAMEEADAMIRSKAKFASVKRRSKAGQAETLKAAESSSQERAKPAPGVAQLQPRAAGSVQARGDDAKQRGLIATASPLDSRSKKATPRPHLGLNAGSQPRSSPFMQAGGGSIYGSPSFLSSQLQKQKK